MSNTLTATHELALADFERLPEVVDLVTECNRASAELLHRKLNIPLAKADAYINRLVAEGVLVRGTSTSDAPVEGEPADPGKVPAASPPIRPKKATVKEVEEAASAWAASLREMAPEVLALSRRMRAGLRQRRVQAAACHLDSALRALELALE